MFGTRGFGCLVGDYIHEVLLGFNKIIHRFASQFDELFRLVWLPGFRCRHPGMSLFAGNLQEFLLHIEKRLDAAPHQIGDLLCCRQFADSLLDAVHQDFILLLAQFQQYLLPLNEIGHALPGYFAKNGRRRVLRIGQLLPHRVHDACILPHGEIHEDPLRSKETLYALLGPTGKKRNKGRFPRMSCDAYRCRHVTPPCL